MGLLLEEDSLSWEGIWDERESDKENSNLLRIHFILMIKLNVFSEPHDLEHYPEETFFWNTRYSFCEMTYWS